MFSTEARSFVQALEAASIPVDGGRKISGIAHAGAASEAARKLAWSIYDQSLSVFPFLSADYVAKVDDVLSALAIPAGKTQRWQPFEIIPQSQIDAFNALL